MPEYPKIDGRYSMLESKWGRAAVWMALGIVTGVLIGLFTGSLLAWTIAGLGFGYSWAFVAYKGHTSC
jgi:hypothetical protein